MVDFILFFFSAKKGQENYKIPDVGIFAKKVKWEFCDFDLDNHGTHMMIIRHNAILLQANTSRRIYHRGGYMYCVCPIPILIPWILGFYHRVKTHRTDTKRVEKEGLDRRRIAN